MFGAENLDLKIKTMSGNIFNMIVFDKIKTGNPLFDSTITILIVSCATFLFQYLNNYVLIFEHDIDNECVNLFRQEDGRIKTLPFIL